MLSAGWLCCDGDKGSVDSPGTCACVAAEEEEEEELDKVDAWRYSEIPKGPCASGWERVRS